LSGAPEPTPWRCLEVVDRVELFEPRGEERGWPPYARLGRAPDPAGHYRLVELTDFGTAREHYAADDTWSALQVLAYVKMRGDTASPAAPAPLEVGEIVPENEGGALEKGMHVPPGHLDVLPRVYVVDERPNGVDLELLAHGPPLATAAARGLFVVIGSVLERIHRWARSDGPSALRPEQVTLAVWVTSDGHVVTRPHFHFQPSEDYSPHSSEADVHRRLLSGTLTQREAEELLLSVNAGPRRARALADAIAALSPLVEPALAADLARLARSFEWIETPTAFPPLTHVELAALAAHVGRHFPRAAEGRSDERLLTAPPAGADLRRRRTRPANPP
jgi:hypothetical protein